jgi:catechol 2,3-dioxygenase-like lactoylglutathione lyase family enzyme
MQAPSPDALVQGLDHVPIAVTDLEAASRRYDALGFRLKPGQPHANGIRNQHVKFPNGTELELITAPKGVDPLTREYREHLASGDGPAFAGFFAADRARLDGTLSALGLPTSTEGGLTTFPARHPLRYLFFGNRTASPTDRPEHFAHPNGARALLSLWLAVDDGNVRALMTSLGVSFDTVDVDLPNTRQALRGSLPEGDILLLPHTRQVVPGRPIAGVTLQIDTLSATCAALTQAPASIGNTLVWRDHSVFIPPGVAHGLWIELREGTRSRSPEVPKSRGPEVPHDLLRRRLTHYSSEPTTGGFDE